MAHRRSMLSNQSSTSQSNSPVGHGPCLLGSLACSKHGKVVQHVDMPSETEAIVARMVDLVRKGRAACKPRITHEDKESVHEGNGNPMGCTIKASIQPETSANGDPDVHDEHDEESDDDDQSHVAFDEPRQMSSTRTTLFLAIAAARKSATVPSISKPATSSPRLRSKPQSPFHLWRKKRSQRAAAKNLLEDQISALQSINPRAPRKKSVPMAVTPAAAAAALEPDVHQEPQSQQMRNFLQPLIESSESMGQAQSQAVVDKCGHSFDIKQLAIAQNMGIHAEAIGEVLEEFCRLDIYGDGNISKEGFVSIVNRLGEFTDEYLVRLWEVADADKNGKINWPEFLQWYKYHCWKGFSRPD